MGYEVIGYWDKRSFYFGKVNVDKRKFYFILGFRLGVNVVFFLSVL